VHIRGINLFKALKRILDKSSIAKQTVGEHCGMVMGQKIVNFYFDEKTRAIPLPFCSQCDAPEADPRFSEKAA
jgi:hypothetical protein